MCVCLKIPFFRLSHFYFYSFLSSDAQTHTHTRKNNIKQINIKRRAHHQHHVKCYFICLLYFEYKYTTHVCERERVPYTRFFIFNSLVFFLLFLVIVVVAFSPENREEKKKKISSRVKAT